MRLTWLGQGGYIVEQEGCRLAIDPYLSNSLSARGMHRIYPPPLPASDLDADFIVCTHDHGDHFDPDSVLPAVAARRNTVVLGPGSVCRHAVRLGLGVQRLAPETGGNECGPFTLHAVPARHSDPDAVGLVVEAAGHRIYVTGDTTFDDDLVRAASAFGPIDLLLICINGKLGNMTAEDAVRVADAVRPHLAIPMHYGLFSSNTADPETFIAPVREGGIAARELPVGVPVPLLPFRGIVPPVITLLKDDETLDEAAFRVLLDKLASAGLPALFICGTCGLGPALTDEVYRQTLRTAVDAVGDRVPLLAGVMEPSTGRAVARLKMVEDAGIRHAVVSIPYFFLPRSEQEFAGHFETCAAATSLTLLPYNLPQYTRASIPVEVIEALWKCGRIGGLKDTSGDPGYFSDLCTRAGAAGLPIFQGNRPDLAQLVWQGASGAVPVPANAEPELYAAAWRAAVSGDPESAVLQTRADELWSRLVEGADFLSGTLARLAREGIGQQRLPLPWKARLSRAAPVSFSTRQQGGSGATMST